MKRSPGFHSRRFLSITALLFILSSFSTRFGGEGFEVFRNNKLVCQQFGNNMKNIKTLRLNNVSSADQITIKYYHCGRAGRNRHIIVRGSDNRELKTWQFANTESADQGMSFKPADILAAKNKRSSTTVNVFYTSTDIPKERQLLILQLNS